MARRTASAAYRHESDIWYPGEPAAAAANPGPSHLDQSPAQPLVDGFGAARGAELAEQRFDVKLDGVLGNPEPSRHRLVAGPVADGGEHLSFARRQQRRFALADRVKRRP